jgi:hypothetical protein
MVSKNSKNITFIELIIVIAVKVHLFFKYVYFASYIQEYTFKKVCIRKLYIFKFYLY